MPRLYIPISIVERMPIFNQPHRLKKIVLIDNCGILHTVTTRNIERTNKQALLDNGYIEWLEEVDVPEYIFNKIRREELRY